MIAKFNNWFIIHKLIEVLEVIKCFLIYLYKQSAWITTVLTQLFALKLFAEQPIKIQDRDELNDNNSYANTQTRLEISLCNVLKTSLIN